MPVAIVALVMGSFLLFIKMLLDYNKDKMLTSGRQDASSNTLLLSELQEMINQSVQQAVEPLHERVDQLEQLALLPADADVRAPKALSQGPPRD
ncbi:MAG: hypothetical protein O3C45_04950 [Bacteroidetes bacterium]|nr:hypothetical protein [Bacteroidota bacterium]MDA0874395.1 hypothetical protein [Bacteroidota bacterium]